MLTVYLEFRAAAFIIHFKVSGSIVSKVSWNNTVLQLLTDDVLRDVEESEIECNILMHNMTCKCIFATVWSYTVSVIVVNTYKHSELASHIIKKNNKKQIIFYTVKVQEYMSCVRQLLNFVVAFQGSHIHCCWDEYDNEI